jgi:hypothetical protein
MVERPILYPAFEHLRRNALPNDWQQTNAHDDREPVNKARDAAEALFAPKKQVERAEAPTSAPVVPSQAVHPAPRRPRIIAIPSTMSVTDESVVPPTDPKPTSRRGTNRRRVKLPASEHNRVRTLALYGMTLAEVADLYRVRVDVIEQIVADGPDDQSSAVK